MVECASANRLLLIAKSRQMLATWSIAAVHLYRALYEPSGLYLFLSKGERDSRELVKRLKVMIRELPEGLGEGIKVKEGETTFPNGSRIIALPATESAVRMHSPAGVFWDEMAFTPRSEGIWTAVKPAVDSGGTFIGVSTPNGTDNVFYRLWSDAHDACAKFRLHWMEHPLRDEEWERSARRGLSEERWRQEQEIDFSILADRVYGEFDPELHILQETYFWRRGRGRTFRSIDFGYRNPYVIWAEALPDGSLVVFDEWEGSDATVDSMGLAIRAVDSRNGLAESDVIWTACDPAGEQRTDKGLSSVERLRREGFHIVHRPSEILTGVDLVKSLLRDANGAVRFRFAPQCVRTIEHIRHYRWDPAGGRKPYKDDVHDHAMDALRYLVVSLLDGSRPAWSGARVAGVGR